MDSAVVAGARASTAQALTGPASGMRPTPPALRQRLTPLLWIGPSLLLMLATIVFPIIELVTTSASDLSRAGISRGFAGWDNYIRLIDRPSFWPVVAQTLVWAALVLSITTVISLPVASLLNARFPGRRWVRYAVLVPWAAAASVTLMIVKWAVNYYYGAVNIVGTDLGVLPVPIDWLGSAETAWLVLLAACVFMSVPFTAYVFLAGMSGIPGELYEAARLDGVGRWGGFVHVTLPLLRPSIAIAGLLNLIGAFNAFTVIWLLTQGGPGTATDITSTLMYKLAFRNRDLGASAAMGVINLLLMLAVILVYLWATRSREEKAA